VGGEWWLGRNNRARNAGDLQRLARDIVVQLVNHVVQIDFDGHWRFSLAPSPIGVTLRVSTESLR
jgi:hypothetical protein